MIHRNIYGFPTIPQPSHEDELTPHQEAAEAEDAIVDEACMLASHEDEHCDMYNYA